MVQTKCATGGAGAGPMTSDEIQNRMGEPALCLGIRALNFFVHLTLGNEMFLRRTGRIARTAASISACRPSISTRRFDHDCDQSDRRNDSADEGSEDPRA